MQPYCHYSAIFDIVFQSSELHLYLKCLFSLPNLGLKRSSVKENVHTLFPAQKIHTGKTRNLSFFTVTFKKNHNNFYGLYVCLGLCLLVSQSIISGLWVFMGPITSLF